MLHKIGALFKKKTKDGKDYLSGEMFGTQGEQDGIHILVFSSESKSGNKYYTVNVGTDEGEDEVEALQRLKVKVEEEIKKASEKEIEPEDVEGNSQESLDVKDLPF